MTMTIFYFCTFNITIEKININYNYRTYFQYTLTEITRLYDSVNYSYYIYIWEVICILISYKY